MGKKKGKDKKQTGETRKMREKERRKKKGRRMGLEG